MSTRSWEFQYSVDAAASREFAWQFWTNIANWRELEPGVQFEMDGPFAPGVHGRTKMPGQEPMPWLIREVDPGRSWRQEMELPDALFVIQMQFEDVGGGRTRITQRLWLEGAGAHKLLDGIRIFETTTPDGLKRIASVIEAAKRKAGDSET